VEQEKTSNTLKRCGGDKKGGFKHRIFTKPKLYERDGAFGEGVKESVLEKHRVENNGRKRKGPNRRRQSKKRDRKRNISKGERKI